jgi:lysophospholipase L1-like esterase
VNRRDALLGLATLPATGAALARTVGIKSVVDWPNVKRIAVLGDSISSRNAGAAMHSWPELLDSMIRSLGVFDVEVRNYSLPGLTWRQAFTPTPPRLIGNQLSPLDAIKRDGCDLMIVFLGVNDRTPIAKAEAQAFADAASSLPYLVARQSIYDPAKPEDSQVSAADQAIMDDAYSVFGDKFIRVGGLNVLYRLGYTFDGLHPTDSGKQWIASNFYFWLQDHMPLTPIVRNGQWLVNQTPALQDLMRKANT